VVSKEYFIVNRQTTIGSSSHEAYQYQMKGRCTVQQFSHHKLLTELLWRLVMRVNIKVHYWH